MSRMSGAAGGFGGPRVVKPQPNVYTVLVAVAVIVVAAALIWEFLVVMPAVQDPPPAPAPGGKTAQVQTLEPTALASADLPALEPAPTTRL